MCINELQMDNDHTYAKVQNRELRILKEKFDLVLSEDEENNEIPGNVSGSSGTNSRVLQADLGQGEEDGEDNTFPQDLTAEGEEEGAGFSGWTQSATYLLKLNSKSFKLNISNYILFLQGSGFLCLCRPVG